MTVRSQDRVTKLDYDVEWLYDELYDEYVKVVEICTGGVYLRWPHQDDKTHKDKIPDDSHIESHFYNWPLDGRRFTVVNDGPYW